LSCAFFFTSAPCHKGVLGSGGIAPHILDLGTRWRWVFSFTPWLLYSQGKNPRYPLDRRLGGLQSQSGCNGKEKNSQPLLALEPLITQPIVIPLSYSSSSHTFVMCPNFICKIRIQILHEAPCYLTGTVHFPHFSRQMLKYWVE
jgi:hypothetical protein